MTENWDVIVIGAGISGLSVGAMLANSGSKVLVVEKNDFIGGRCSRVEHEGYTFDVAGHSYGGEGYLDDVYDKIGKPLPEMSPVAPFTVFIDNEWKGIADITPKDEVKKTYKEIVSMSDEEIEELSDTSIKDWLEERNASDDLHRFYLMIGQLYLSGNSYEKISARDLMFIIKRSLVAKGTQKGYWIEGGSSQLNVPLADAIREKGGQILLNTNIDEVIIKNGVVQGVRIAKPPVPGYWEIGSDKIEAPIVISSLPLWQFFNIVSEEELPKSYVAWIKSIMHKTSYLWTLIVGLKKPAWKESSYKFKIITEPLGFNSIGVEYSHFQKTGIPEGQGLMTLSYQGNYDEFPNVFQGHTAVVKKQIENVFHHLQLAAKEMIEDFDENCIWQLKHPAVYSIAQEPCLSGHFRPGVKVPAVKGFYLASDTINTRGVGVQGAAFSALNCFERIINDNKK